MATNTSPAVVETDAPQAAARSGDRWLWLALAALAVLLLVGVPLHLCMPPWIDVTMYDLCARNVLHGGVAYREILENNLPGIVWIHMGIRTLCGWSSLALRAADLLIVGAVVALLAQWPGRRKSAAFRVAAAAILVLFYFSTKECCHCQRDVWMMLPAVMALWLRRRQVERLTEPSGTVGRAALWSVAEGLCWGAAVWIKPFVLVPALACWLVSTTWIARRSERPVLLLLADTTGLLAGGLAAGGLGVAWLMETGAWPYFLDVMLDWNVKSDYYRPHQDWWSQLVSFAIRFHIWQLAHVAAIPLAVLLVVRAVRAPRLSGGSGAGAALAPWGLLAAFYFGWLLQVVLLQHKFDYILAPPLLLALGLLAAVDWPSGAWAARVPLLAGFLVLLAILMHPLLQPRRLAVWGSCWREGASAEIKDRLALGTDHAPSPRWVELEKIAGELRARGVDESELICFSLSTIHLYLALDLRPPTRIVMLESWIIFYPERMPQLCDEFLQDTRRYIVTDLRSTDLDRFDGSKERSDPPLELPAWFPHERAGEFPWSEPIIYRTNRYLLHELRNPEQRAD